MQFAVLLAFIAALSVGTSAVVIERQANPRLAQFRVYSDRGCSSLNDGFFTVDKSDANICHSFADISDPTPFVSLDLELLTVDAAGCTLLIYSDSTCSQDQKATAVGTCNNASVVEAGATVPTWNSWQLQCSTSA